LGKTFSLIAVFVLFESIEYNFQKWVEQIMANKWLEVQKFGQSLWYDNMSRSFVTSGELQKMIAEMGLCGITSNPSIFEKAISKGKEYDEDIESSVQQGLSTDETYDRLTTDDIRAAADVLRQVYEDTDRVDGYVSIEVDARLANDTEKSIEAARRLWTTIGRPNIMIKIPGTPAGIPAIHSLLREGINVNITLLFGLDNYSAVANAFVTALTARHHAGEDVSHIASVASFFLSRVDTNVDKLIQEKIADNSNETKKAHLTSLLGTAANANAKLAYERFQHIFHGKEFAKLHAAGAKVQRCLWASVSTKNPAYSDVMYIEPLIGSETVTTVPDETIAAFADHGVVADTLQQGMSEAHKVINDLKSFDIDTEQVAAELQLEGVKKFIDAFAALSAKLDAKRQHIVTIQ
jgi:transaldolase